MKLLSGALAFLLVALVGCRSAKTAGPDPAHPQPAAQPVTASQQAPRPETVAVQFYQWYLQQLTNNKVPTDDMNGAIKPYLSTRLRAQLTKTLKTDDVESDYFLRAQDFLSDWSSSVTAAPSINTGNTANITVSLGNGQSLHPIGIDMVLEDGAWRIDAVHASTAR